MGRGLAWKRHHKERIREKRYQILTGWGYHGEGILDDLSTADYDINFNWYKENGDIMTFEEIGWFRTIYWYSSYFLSSDRFYRLARKDRKKAKFKIAQEHINDYYTNREYYEE